MSTIDAVIGKWTYRSFLNTPALVDGDAAKALGLIFGEGVFTFEPAAGGDAVAGTLDMGGGYVLDLAVKAPAGGGTPTMLAITGTGRDGSPTAGWEYDYNCALGYRWPNGVDQVPSLLGTVIRAKPHGGAPAGVVASFIAVKQA